MNAFSNESSNFIRAYPGEQTAQKHDEGAREIKILDALNNARAGRNINFFRDARFKVRPRTVQFMVGCLIYTRNN